MANFAQAKFTNCSCQLLVGVWADLGVPVTEYNDPCSDLCVDPSRTKPMYIMHYKSKKVTLKTFVSNRSFLLLSEAIFIKRREVITWVQNEEMKEKLLVSGFLHLTVQTLSILMFLYPRESLPLLYNHGPRDKTTSEKSGRFFDLPETTGLTCAP